MLNLLSEATKKFGEQPTKKRATLQHREANVPKRQQQNDEMLAAIDLEEVAPALPANGETKQLPPQFQRMHTGRLHASTDKAAMLEKLQGNLGILRKEVDLLAF